MCIPVEGWGPRVCYCFTSVQARHVERTVWVSFFFVFFLPSVMWRLFHQSYPDWAGLSVWPLQRAFLQLLPNLLFIARGHPLRCLPPKAVFTLSRQVCVCVNTSRVKDSPGLPAASFVLHKTNTKTHELLGTVGLLFSCRPGLHVCVCVCVCSSEFVKSFWCYCAAKRLLRFTWTCFCL